MARVKVVVPWHNSEQLGKFMDAWNVNESSPQFVFQQDRSRAGCAKTKNAGVAKAIEGGAEIIIVLDDDCFPQWSALYDINALIAEHVAALQPQPVRMFETVTTPASRGTPYFNRTIKMPVAASMGFWVGIGDYDAPGQLVHGATKPMKFKQRSIHGRYFPLCGMNLAFRAEEWPWCKFIDVPRFDDIWQGFLWQRKAYAEGKCFNLNGPLVRHSRQSNVWQNLRDEAQNLERNETIWETIAGMPLTTHQEMLAELGLTT